MSLLNKRKKPEPKQAGGLPELDRKVLEVIKSKKEMAIWTRDLKTETNLTDAAINKCIKNLLNSSHIKEVVHVQQKGRKHYIAAEFEPSKEITGGSWYANRLTNTECTSQQVSEILRSMVLDNMIIDVKSTGLGEYHSIPVGQVCYRCPPGDLNKGPKTGALVSIPCGICPRIRECTPDGLISPTTCVYYTKWLDF
ncbi:putative RNA polymerase Rpc34, winged helix-like DNA-binding domain superfamily [Helianthus annuus]|nr:putative RNA polymerase Rpc34, winged helix-like DNA-binding domain superfamily [Helianthus annuus]KAJ0630273.1 putative RNA polymerase Rpc34, winged helix-like DNA-binding domain superfamily [Helianthus annuus]